MYILCNTVTVMTLESSLAACVCSYWYRYFLVFVFCYLYFITYLCNCYHRGLLLPKVVVEDIGGTRTDAGMLGYGIYFADSAR